MKINTLLFPPGLRLPALAAGAALGLIACSNDGGGGAGGGTGGATGTGAGATAGNPMGGPTAGASAAGSPVTGGASGGATTAGTSTAGTATAGTSTAGTSAAGMSTSGGMGTGGGMTTSGGMGASGDTGSGGTGNTGTGGTGASGMGTGGAGEAGMGDGGGGTGGGAGPTSSDVTVQLTSTHQTIEGFGINNTYATSSFSNSVADHLFTTDGDGLGLSILRIGMGPNGDYATSGVSGDTQAARSRGAKIIGSTWTPPGSYKTDGTENDGGHLLPENYQQWATTITNFATQNDLYAMSVGNEPDFASCGEAEPCNGNYATTLYTGAEMAAFVKVVGPMLQAAGVKVIAPEASEWIHNWSNESACCSENNGLESSDPLNCGFPPTNPSCDNFNGYDYGHALYADSEAWAAFDIMGVHEYDTQHAEPWPDDVPDRKPVWQTEMSGVKWWPEQGPSTDINNGVAVAEWIHSALVVGDASAWLYWWYQAYYTDDNEGLLLKNGNDTKRHWTFGNYSKFVRPDYVRVDVTGEIPADVLLSAYKGPDDTVVVVAINKTNASVDVPITIAGGAMPAEMTPWVTSAMDNLAAKDPVTVTGGIFMATLAGPGVTTFVSQ